MCAVALRPSLSTPSRMSSSNWMKLVRLSAGHRPLCWLSTHACVRAHAPTGTHIYTPVLLTTAHTISFCLCTHLSKQIGACRMLRVLKDRGEGLGRSDALSLFVDKRVLQTLYRHTWILTTR